MDRVVLAKQRLAQLTSDAKKVLEAGPPCSTCRYKTLSATCSNPALEQMRFDPPSGRFDVDHPTPVAVARAEDGVCGPEAILWEDHSLPQAMWREGTAWMDRHPLFSTIGLLFAVGMIAEALF